VFLDKLFRRQSFADFFAVLDSKYTTFAFHVARIKQFYLPVFSCTVDGFFLIGIDFESVLNGSILNLLSDIVKGICGDDLKEREMPSLLEELLSVLGQQG
jgi:hypothetical protein